MFTLAGWSSLVGPAVGSCWPPLPLLVVLADICPGLVKNQVKMLLTVWLFGQVDSSYNLRADDIQIPDAAGNRTVDQLHLIRVPPPSTDIPHLVTRPRNQH